MITALNYAAQVERSLKEHASNANNSDWIPIGSKNDIQEYQEHAVSLAFAETINKAVHFVLPEDGIIFDDELKGIKDTQLKLPYDRVTLEYRITGKKYNENQIKNIEFNKRFLLAEKASKSTLFNIIQHITDDYVQERKKLYIDENIFVTNYLFIDNQWIPNALGYIIPCAWENNKFPSAPPTCSAPPAIPRIAKPEKLYPFTSNQKTKVPFEPVVIYAGRIEKQKEKYGIEKTEYMWSFATIPDIRALLEFCEALSCVNVKSDIIQHENKAINIKRQKNNKLPLYETRILTLTLPTKSREKSVSNESQDRRSPRQHLRRGHIRRLDDKRKIWVNSCVVGKSEDGIIEKTYNITAVH